MFGHFGGVISSVQTGSCFTFLGAITLVFVAAFGRRPIGSVWVVTAKVVGAHTLELHVGARGSFATFDSGRFDKVCRWGVS